MKSSKMGKVGTPKKAKSAGGQRRVVDLTPRSVAAAKPKPEDKMKIESRKKALEKAHKVQRVKATARRVEASMGNVVDRSFDLLKERFYKRVGEWETDNIPLFKHMAELVDNGLLQQEFEAAQQTTRHRSALEKAGPPAFTSGAKTWKGLKVQAAKQILGTLLDRKADVAEVFDTMKENHLKGEVATKSVRFLLGVTEDTEIPWGHELSECTNVLEWICKEVFYKRGDNKLHDVLDLRQLEDASDWWQSKGGGDSGEAYTVCLSTRPKVNIDLSDYPIDRYDDWEILDADKFNAATLYSQKGRFNQPLWMKVPPVSTPIWNTPFHFEEGDKPLGFPTKGNFTGESADAELQTPTKAALRRFRR